MEIERINENTVKFFLSYKDIEERGFTREEVWYNRDKSEELFWEMMDEVNEESEFEVDGPLWIQIHAMNSGIEVTVTRAQSTIDGHVEDSPFSDDDPTSPFPSGGEMFNDSEAEMHLGGNGTLEWTESIFFFKDFEDIILLTNRMKEDDVKTALYELEGTYYLHALFDSDHMDSKFKTDFFSVVSEFATPSNITIHRLQEYGNIIMESDVFTKIETYFGSQ